MIREINAVMAKRLMWWLVLVCFFQPSCYFGLFEAVIPVECFYCSRKRWDVKYSSENERDENDARRTEWKAEKGCFGLL